jgi:membrane AbrB-like protein
MISSPLLRGASTMGIGAAGGLVFNMLSLPLPWVLGSITATALTAHSSGFRAKLPVKWRSYAMVAIGTMLGTGFTQEVVAQSGRWAMSLIVMSLLSLVFGLLAYVVFRRWGKMDPATAMFSAMPGGLSMVTMLAEQYKTEVNRVVLCHSARIIVLLVTAPIIIQMISDINLSDANRLAFHSAENIDPLRHGVLALAAIISWFIATRVNFPSAMLLVPLLASAFLHATGLITVHVPSILSILAQVAIGSSVGARFANYSLIQIVRDGWLAAVVGGGLALGSLACAAVIAPIAGVDMAPLFLSYLPGGAPELGVVALALMIDPAMVAAHHVLRVFLIVLAMPVLMRRLSRGDPDKQT